MEIWVLESASEKLKILRCIEKKGKGIILGHKRGDSFIVEDLIPLKKLDLNSEKFISSLISNTNFLGFFNFEEDEPKNLPEFFYGSIIVKILKEGIKGYFIEFKEKNILKMMELSVKVLSREGKNG